MPDKYDDYDWDELPKEAQEAAKKLGYNKVRGLDGELNVFLFVLMLKIHRTFEAN